MRGVDDLEVALNVGAGRRIEDGTAVGVEDDDRSLAGEHIVQVLPVSSLRQMPPLGPLMAA